MVYLLHRLFRSRRARGSRILLARRSGDTDNPRILGAFNEPTPDCWPSNMFRFFTIATANSSCAPWPIRLRPSVRTCRFMLTRSPSHVRRRNGVSRIIQRTVT